ncbi:hypothetical protein [Micromonospora sp. WMMD998]|uniref:hypothetical protein n=1 Tax=Micromonospora sp. WMMD998 TaxID=3016092 RepID=UPI00249C46F1|nr:hypothetical protein [Micromonospora sp. WMMD998]WFE36909.1 hypothetical protein O7619_00060 [Micromonospora sp. WMMD998]WFE36946.1 hypothetical protein O7619_00250 [Micromonospora sp. WMMD998]
MSETGQPGAPTPGEHGDGTGQQDDPARTGGGWAPPANGWSRGTPAPGGWPYSDLGGGWAASSPRHGDLPAPLPGHVAGEPAVHANGRHVNGVRHAGEESSVTRQAPVSAPPVAEPPRESDGDRLAVPAPRPTPAIEQQPDPTDSAGSRHASDDTSAHRVSRWAESGPTSAPPALQVPPVGAAASGFEMPPGFHAPTVDPALSSRQGWSGRGPVDPPAAGAGHADQAPADPAAHRPADPRPPDGPRPPEGPPAATDHRGADPRAAAGSRGAGSDDPTTGGEPDWPGPSWNRPSWGDGWAPPWARTDEPVGHRATRDDEPADRRPRDDEPSGRRAARAAEWAPEPVRPYEPARVEPPAGYEPPRPEPVRPYEPVRAESAAGHEPPYPEPTRPFRLPREEPRPGYEPPERPSWAGPPVPVTPFGGSARPEPTGAPVSREAPAAYAPAADEPAYAPGPTADEPAYAPTADDGAYAPAPTARAAGEPADGPRRVPDRSTAEPAGVRPLSAVPATGGTARFDPAPAPRPSSAPPYTARRSAPEPPAVGAVAEPQPGDPAPAVLPQRVPAEPDVPVVPEPPAVEPSAETPELARIATHLRRDDEPAPLRERPEGFDVNAILDAVREVAGVRDAALRRTPAGAHSLRLDLADGADPADVSRLVARLLQERMGLAAAPQNLPGAPPVPPPPVRRRSATPRADRLAELAEGRSGTPQPRADDQSVAPTRDAGSAGPGEDDTSARAGAGRPTSSRPTGNRSGEGRPGGVESRTGRPADVPVEETEPGEPPRRRRQTTHRGRATVDDTSLAAAPTGMSTGSPVTLGTSYSGGQMTTTETAPSRPLDPGGAPGPRVVIDHVLVSTFGLDATTEVRLIAGDRAAEGHATGPAVDGYVLRLCAVAAAVAVDELLGGEAPAGERGRCFVEHAAVVPFGNCEVATVVVLLVCDGWVEQLAGSALVAGDPRQAVVRAMLAAVNRRLEALLA